MVGIIYCWTNKSNRKRYIGQTVREEWRKKQHIYSSHRKKGWLSAFHTALREVGEAGFEYKVMFRIESDDTKLVKRLLDEKEEYYIRKYKSCLTDYGYNETVDGQYKKHIFNDAQNKNKRLKIKKEKTHGTIAVEEPKEPKLNPTQQKIVEQIRHLCEGMRVPMPSIEWTNY